MVIWALPPKLHPSCEVIPKPYLRDKLGDEGLRQSEVTCKQRTKRQGSAPKPLKSGLQPYLSHLLVRLAFAYSN